jgi:ABC-type nitrate/sulfonate/bicarbonate transport system permease component
VTRHPRPEALRGLLAGLAGTLLLLALWQEGVDHVFSGRGTIPSPLQIARQFAGDGLALYLASAAPTLHTALVGWLVGNALAIALAFLVVAIPPIERPVLQLGAVSYCLPIVAIGPVLIVIFSGGTPRIILSALSVFFITLVGTIAGLRSVDRSLLDSIHAFGGGALAKLREARCRAALPYMFAALRVAAPAAILGSIVGEFMGAEGGLGILLINSQQGMNYPRTWAVALFTTALAGIAYLAIGLAGNLLTPWARETHANLAGETAERAGGMLRAAGIPVGLQVLVSACFSVFVVLLAWVLLLRVFHVSPFIGKGPADVWAYLSDPNSGAENRAALWGESAVSLRDAFLGLASGTVAALVAASLFNVAPTVRKMLMGPAMTLQSVPLVAMTPLIVLIFGRNLPAIAVIGGIVTFFPTLVNLTLALDRTPQDSIDLMRVFGASRLETLTHVQIPNALPALFSSLRVASPLAITGAMLAEWLATGSGLGYSIASDVATSDYDALWTRVALATLFSLTLYQGIRYLERVTIGRLMGAPST